MREWSLITNHGLVLAAILRNSKKTIREIGDDVGVTERTAYAIVVDLEKAGYIERTKVGTRNMYAINHDMPLVSRLSDASVGDMVALFSRQYRKRTKRTKVLREVNA
ncbi:helix-turn-helix transcriptional regulator [Chloroflexota bacterium]